jgi:hypothetical protein
MSTHCTTHHCMTPHGTALHCMIPQQCLHEHWLDVMSLLHKKQNVMKDATTSDYPQSSVSSSSLSSSSLPSLESREREMFSDAFSRAFTMTNNQLHHASDINDNRSGTTAVVALMYRGNWHVGNVGDSRWVSAILSLLPVFAQQW